MKKPSFLGSFVSSLDALNIPASLTVKEVQKALGECVNAGGDDLHSRAAASAERAREAEREALKAVRCFNAILSAKGYSVRVDDKRRPRGQSYHAAYFCVLPSAIIAPGARLPL
jgi:hypothetical protein